MSDNFSRHLSAAQGYLELGMFTEAENEVEKIGPEDKIRPEVIGFRVQLYIAAEKWEAGYVVARQMVGVETENVTWWHSLCMCARYSQSVRVAENIAFRALQIFPNDALLQLNLAIYACVQGRIAEAKLRLRAAIALNEKMRLIALKCRDLEPVWKASAK